MENIGRDILMEPNIFKFLSYFPDEPHLPAGIDYWEIDAVDILRIYIRRCGGDADMTIDHFVQQGAEDPRRPDPRFLSD